MENDLENLVMCLLVCACLKQWEGKKERIMPWVEKEIKEFHYESWTLLEVFFKKKKKKANETNNAYTPLNNISSKAIENVANWC